MARQKVVGEGIDPSEQKKPRGKRTRAADAPEAAPVLDPLPDPTEDAPLNKLRPTSFDE